MIENRNKHRVHGEILCELLENTLLRKEQRE
jgi:hypothetical protein